MTSDILIIHNDFSPIEETAAQRNVPEWTSLQQDVYWQGAAADYEDAVTIDIVGLADLQALGAQFLLLP